MTHGFSTSRAYYLDLINNFPPRIVRNEEDFIATQKQIYKILDRENISEDEQEYLNLLGVIIHDYEEEWEPIPRLSSNEKLRLLLEEYNLNTRDLLPIFASENKINEVLSGKRKITKEQKKQLAKLFKVSPSFFDQEVN